jgi:hypothetical protein
MHTYTPSRKRKIQLCLPDDTWAIISLFVKRTTLPAVFYISKKIQQIVIDSILSCSTIYNLFFSYFSVKRKQISNKVMYIAQQIFIVAKQRRLYIGINIGSFLYNCSRILKPKFMIELFQHVEPFIDNNFPIRWASKNGHLEIAKLLLSDERVNLSA